MLPLRPKDLHFVRAWLSQGARLFPRVWLISLCLSAVIAAIWIRSYRVRDSIRWGTVNSADTVSRWFAIDSSRGIFGFTWDRLVFDQTVPDFASAADSFPEGHRLHWKAWIDQPNVSFLNIRTNITFWNRHGFYYKSNFTQGAPQKEFVPQNANPTTQPIYVAIPPAVNASYRIRFVGFPIWLMILCFVGLPLARLRILFLDIARRRRSRRGLCPTCSYDLRFSPNICPECGSPNPTAATKNLAVAVPTAWPRRITVSLTLATTAFACFRIGWPNVPDLVRGQVPSWIVLGDLTTPFEDQKPLLSLGPEPYWFTPYSRPSTWIEVTAAVSRYEWSDLGFPNADGYTLSFVGIDNQRTPEEPCYPNELPTEEDGVRLSLSATPTSTNGELLFIVTMTNTSHTAQPEVDRTLTLGIPFLFAFYVDGRPLVLDAKHPGVTDTSPLGPMSYLALDWGATGSSQAWECSVDQKSLRALLSDSKPHTIDIYAAFGSAAFMESFAAGGVMTLGSPGKPGDTPLLIRSNPARLLWTGSQWKSPDSNGGSPK